MRLSFAGFFNFFDEAFAEAKVGDIEELIKSCGLYKTKAKDISAMAKMLCAEYNGIVPDTIEELVRLPGIGRKTANLVVGDIFGKPAVVVDTHCIRITSETRRPRRASRSFPSRRQSAQRAAPGR